MIYLQVVLGTAIGTSSFTLVEIILANKDNWVEFLCENVLLSLVGEGKHTSSWGLDPFLVPGIFGCR